MKTITFLLVLPLVLASLSSCGTTNHNQGIRVISLQKEVDIGSPNADICRSFSLTKDDVVTYFSVAEKVDEYQFHHEAIIMPCKYTGNIEIGDERYQWTIYAGGAGYLFKSDVVTKRFLCKARCCEALPKVC